MVTRYVSVLAFSVFFLSQLGWRQMWFDFTISFKKVVYRPFSLSKNSNAITNLKSYFSYHHRPCYLHTTKVHTFHCCTYSPSGNSIGYRTTLNKTQSAILFPSFLFFTKHENPEEEHKKQPVAAASRHWEQNADEFFNYLQ